MSRTETPWNKVFDPLPTTIEHALVAAGLDWEVLSKPAYYLESAQDMHNGKMIELTEVEQYDDDDLMLAVNPVPGWYVNVRSDSGKPLGIVSQRYSPFHNLQAFAWLSQIFGTEMEFIAAGDFMNSRRVWVLMRLPSFIEVAGEKIGQYAFVHTSHDGKHSVTASMTPYLVRTATLMTTELRRAHDFNAHRTVAIRHVGNMDEKVQAAEAERVLGVSINYYKQFEEFAKRLASKPVGTLKEAHEYAAALLPIDEEKMGERAQRNTEAARQKIERLFLENGEQGEAPGSWWALYLAAVEFADWVRPERKKGGRFQRAIDDPDSFKSTAFDLALAATGL